MTRMLERLRSSRVGDCGAVESCVLAGAASSTGGNGCRISGSAVTEQHGNEQDSNAEKGNNGHGCRYAAICAVVRSSADPGCGRWRRKGRPKVAARSPARACRRARLRQAWIACGYLIDLHPQSPLLKHPA